jgi:hypothetical protein
VIIEREHDIAREIGNVLVESIGKRRYLELEFYQAHEAANAEGDRAEETRLRREEVEDEWRRFQIWRIGRAAALAQHGVAA